MHKCSLRTGCIADQVTSHHFLAGFYDRIGLHQVPTDRFEVDLLALVIERLVRADHNAIAATGVNLGVARAVMCCVDRLAVRGLHVETVVSVDHDAVSTIVISVNSEHLRNDARFDGIVQFEGRHTTIVSPLNA